MFGSESDLKFSNDIIKASGKGYIPQEPVDDGSTFLSGLGNVAAAPSRGIAQAGVELTELAAEIAAPALEHVFGDEDVAGAQLRLREITRSMQIQQDENFVAQTTQGLANFGTKIMAGSAAGASIGAVAGLGVGSVPLALAGAASGAVLTGVSEGYQQYQRLRDENVDKATARKAAILEGAVTAASVALPASLGVRLGTKIATGVAMNVAAGGIERETQSSILERNGYKEMAEMYRWDDGKILLADAVLGAAFPAFHHLGMKIAGQDLPKVDRESLDAALATYSKAKNDEAVGIPVNGRAVKAHSDAMAKATDQVIIEDRHAELGTMVDDAEFLPKEHSQNAVNDVLSVLKESGLDDLAAENDRIRAELDARGVEAEEPSLGEVVVDKLPDNEIKDSVRSQSEAVSERITSEEDAATKSALEFTKANADSVIRNNFDSLEDGTMIEDSMTGRTLTVRKTKNKRTGKYTISILDGEDVVGDIIRENESPYAKPYATTLEAGIKNGTFKILSGEKQRQPDLLASRDQGTAGRVGEADQGLAGRGREVTFEPDSLASKAAPTEPRAREVFAGIHDQLKRVGYDDEQAVHNATIITKAFDTFAKRAGLDPRLLWDRYNAQISSAEYAGGDAMMQRSLSELLGEQDMLWKDLEREQAGETTLTDGERNALKSKIRLVEKQIKVLQGDRFYQSSPTFYSALQRGVEGLGQDKANTKQWSGMIRNMQGVKQEEIEWSGVEDWLASQNGPVTRQEVLDYLRANELQVKEVVKGLGDRRDLLMRRNPESQFLYDIIDENGNIVKANLSQNAAGEFLENYHDGQGETKFSQWQLEGDKTGYRELLLTLPDTRNAIFDQIKALNEKMSVANKEERYSDYDKLLAERNALSEKHQSVDVFKSSHFDEPNIVAHIRFNDRTDADGKRVLFIEEIQSDWHQAGRKRGYNKPELTDADLRVAYKKNLIDAGMSEDMAERLARDDIRGIRANFDLSPQGDRGVPDAPFKTTWPELAFKRALRYAVENGYDKITWTTGAQQAERYDLSKQVDRVVIGKNDKGYWMAAWEKAAGEDTESDIEKTGLSAKDLADHVGKDLAEKAIKDIGDKNGQRSYHGIDLKVGGEGMAGFYDNMLPKMVNKLVKKWGGKVGETSITTTGELTAERRYIGPDLTYDEMKAARIRFNSDKYTTSVKFTMDDVMRSFRSGVSFSESMVKEGNGVLAEALGGKLERIDGKSTVHSLYITAPMKDAVMGGLPLFQGQTRLIRAFLKRGENREFLVGLTKHKDASSLMHESGHMFLEIFRDLKKEFPDNAYFKNDWAEVENYLGIKGLADGEVIPVAAHEKWARSFEQYLKDGKAPSTALKRAFESFREWFLGIYKSEAALGVKLTPEIKAVFDRMLATDEEIRELRLADNIPDIESNGQEVSPFIATLRANDEITQSEGMAGAYDAASQTLFQTSRAKYVTAANEAAGRELSPQELKGIEDRIKSAYRKLSVENADDFLNKPERDRIKAASKEAAEGLMAEALKKKQRLLSSLKALSDITEYVEGQVADGQSHFEAVRQTLVFSADSKSKGRSVETGGKVIGAAYKSKLVETLELISPRIFGLFENKNGIKALVFELRGQDSAKIVDAKTAAIAKKAAKAWIDTTDAMRKRFNAAGGEIGKLEDWTVPQHHNQNLVFKAGKKKWIADVLSVIDKNKYVNDDGTPMSEVEIGKFLEKSWLRISTGGAVDAGVSRKGQSAMVARRHAEHRAIHFKNAESLLAYMDVYGGKDFYSTIIGHIDRMATDIALIETYGANPDNTFNSVLNGFIKAEAERTGREPSKEASKLQHYYDEVAGKRLPVASEKLAATFDTIRSLEVASKMGRAVLSSLVLDPVNIRITAAFNNIPQVALTRNNLLSILPKSSMQKKAKLAGLALESFSNGMNRWCIDMLGPRWAAKLGSLTIRASGMAALDNARRTAWGVTMMGSLGDMVKSHKSLDTLNKHDKAVLKSKGITDTDFAVWKLAELEDWGNGNDTMLTLESIFSIDNNKVRESASIFDGKQRDALPTDEEVSVIKQQAAEKLLGHILEEQDMAILVPTSKQRAELSGGMQKGTWRGELWSTFLLFKSFSYSTFGKHVFERGMNLPTGTGRAAYIASFMAGSFLLGAIKVQVDELLKGRDPKDMTDPRFAAQAFLKGGSLGIYGDFLFNTETQFGTSPMEMMAGPVSATAADFLALTHGNLMKAAQGKETHAGAEAVRFFKNNMPLQNLWYTQAIVDRLIFNQLQEYLSSGYMDRIESRARKQYGQEHFWHLDEPLPYRAPNFARAVGE